MKLHARYSALEGRRAVVAVGSSGIGLGVARAFLEQGRVVVHCRSHLVGQDLCVSGGALLVVPRGQIAARQPKKASPGGPIARGRR